ncbi:hypothetical protein NDU88_003525 [Pleurodeles waltl]|uniref:Uncharacterized protein n=1 Tax=Pleurodeles waltl TaxID=8319 RepID=A0AAV7MRE4_PLEWA|nr:hypothetical protein NDU88_003525 [Pleurodeles waltl]
MTPATLLGGGWLARWPSRVEGLAPGTPTLNIETRAPADWAVDTRAAAEGFLGGRTPLYRWPPRDRWRRALEDEKNPDRETGGPSPPSRKNTKTPQHELSGKGTPNQIQYNGHLNLGKVNPTILTDTERPLRPPTAFWGRSAGSDFRPAPGGGEPLGTPWTAGRARSPASPR